MKKVQRIAFLFPGQGSQYCGMARDFFENFPLARLTFEEADDLLKRSISHLILQGSEETLKETQNSQTGIYVASMAMLRVVQHLVDVKPFVCSGLSLGEYAALTAGGWLPFSHTLSLVESRGKWMNEACQSFPGTMAVIMGLHPEVVQTLVDELDLPHDLWVANFNCPGQVVISGTLKGIQLGTAAAKARQAKRILPLQVHGAFHSGLMQKAKEKLAPHIMNAPIVQGHAQLVMNVSGSIVSEVEGVRQHLIKQVTHPVCWEQGVEAMKLQNIDLYIEFGPGKTLAGMNQRIGLQAPVVAIDKVADLDRLLHI